MEQIQEAARAVSGDWLPVVDNVNLFRDPFDPDAPAQSQMVPMMLGNVHDETMVAARGGGEMTWDNAAAALDDAIHQYLGPYKAEEVVAEFRKIHPDYTPRSRRHCCGDSVSSARGRDSDAGRRSGERRTPIQPAADVGCTR